MNDTLVRVDRRLRVNGEREIVGCTDCKSVARRPQETYEAWEDRAWEFGDYHVQLQTALEGWNELLLFVLCDDHFLFWIELDEVENDLQAQFCPRREI